MEKIINYIARGQGLGIKFLLLFSLIVAVFYAVGTKFAGDQFFVPAAQKAADAFLPIRIENGIVTEPENTVKNYTFVLGEGKVPDAESFNLTMDTTVDSLDTSGLKEGLYLTKRALMSSNALRPEFTNWKILLIFRKATIPTRFIPLSTGPSFLSVCSDLLHFLSSTSSSSSFTLPVRTLFPPFSGNNTTLI